IGSIFKGQITSRLLHGLTLNGVSDRARKLGRLEPAPAQNHSRFTSRDRPGNEGLLKISFDHDLRYARRDARHRHAAAAEMHKDTAVRQLGRQMCKTARRSDFGSSQLFDRPPQGSGKNRLAWQPGADKSLDEPRIGLMLFMKIDEYQLGRLCAPANSF